MLRFATISLLSLFLSSHSLPSSAADQLDPKCPNVTLRNSLTPTSWGGRQYPLPQFGLSCNSLFCKPETRGFETRDNLKAIDQLMTQFQAATQRFSDTVDHYENTCKLYISKLNGDGREPVVEAIFGLRNAGKEAEYVVEPINNINDKDKYRFSGFANFVIEKENDPRCSEEIRKVVTKKFSEYNAQLNRYTSIKCSKPDDTASVSKPR